MLLDQPWYIVLLALVLCHYVCDYTFQSDTTAVGKNPARSPHRTVPWGHWMFSHAATHAVGVWLIVGPLYAVLELIMHFLIDWCKCREGRGLDLETAGGVEQAVFLANIDQAAHLLCKVVWVSLFMLLRGLV